MKKKTLSNQQAAQSVSIAHLPDGVYLYEVTLGGQRSTGKVIKASRN